MPTDIANALRAELSASQLDALRSGAEDRSVRPPLSCWWTTVRAASMSSTTAKTIWPSL